MGAFETASKTAASTLVRVELRKTGRWSCIEGLVGRGDVQGRKRWRLEITTKGKGTPSANIGPMTGTAVDFRTTLSLRKKTLRACIEEAWEQVRASVLLIDTLTVSVRKGEVSSRELKPVVRKELARAWTDP